MKLRSLYTMLAVGALAAMGAARAAPQTRYSISDVLVPSLPQGGDYAEIAAINNKGQMAGTAYVPDGKGSYLKHAHLWNNVIALRDLGTLPGGKQSGASGINNLGQVVGWSESATLNLLGNAHLRHAFVWDADNGMRDLGVLPDIPNSESFAISINDAGQALIQGKDKYFNDHAALWDSGKGLQDIGLPPGYAPAPTSPSPSPSTTRARLLFPIICGRSRRAGEICSTSSAINASGLTRSTTMDRPQDFWYLPTPGRAATGTRCLCTGIPSRDW